MQDLITSCENAYTKRQEAKDAAIESANEYMQSEFIAAWLTDPQAKIKTPGFDKTEMTLADVVADSFAGHDGDHVLHQLICIVSEASKGHDMTLVASAFIKSCAQRHAAFHEGDL